MFQRNILPAFSGSKSKARKKPVRNRWQAVLLFNPADGGSSVLSERLSFLQYTQHYNPEYYIL
jgi:hypothetical protein